MFKNKLVKTMVIILFAITLIGVTAIITVKQFSASQNLSGEPTIDEILAQTVETEGITTNLLSNDFVRIQFKIQVDNKNTKEELEKRDFQVKNVIIRELADMEASDFNGSDGLEQLEVRLQSMIGELLKEGTVVKVYTTSLMIQ